MNSSLITFEDIRLIICTEGYVIENIYVPREIGFWSRDNNGVIPIRHRINPNKLKFDDKELNENVIKLHHGIKFEKKINNTLVKSDIRGVILTLYNMISNCDVSKRKYIGIIDDTYMISVLSNCGLGHLLIDLRKINLFSNENINIHDFYNEIINSNPLNYNICGLHSRLETNKNPVCAGALAKVIGVLGNQKINIQNLEN